MHTHWALAGRAILCAMLACATGAGCAVAEEEEEDVEEAVEAIRDGVFTYERPEIGIMVTNGMSYCTATLVSPNVALTAAHCVGYGTEDGRGDKLGFFRIERSASSYEDFEYDAYVSYGSSWGRDDVALLRLKKPVPSRLAHMFLLVPP